MEKMAENDPFVEPEKEEKIVYRLFSVKNYNKANAKFIETAGKDFTLKDTIKELKKDNYYNFRIKKTEYYIFFGDIDNYHKNIEHFFNLLKDFMLEHYNLILKQTDFKYTKNNKKEGSYHYSIPKWYASVEKLKEIHQLLINSHKDEFIRSVDNKTINSLDLSIYTDHWFRCPNQSKGLDLKENNHHIIVTGKIQDFIISYIPPNSININDIKNIKKQNELEKETKNKEIVTIDKDPKPNQNNQIKKYDPNDGLLSSTLSSQTLYKQIFDECYNQNRFEAYEFWVKVGMAINNSFIDMEDAIQLFDYFSRKGSNYAGFENTKNKFLTFIKKSDAKGITVATIHYYAIEDNKPKFIEIMNKNQFELGQTDLCKYLKVIAGVRFIYKKIGDIYKLYCYNGKYWENDDVIMRSCISNELYTFLKKILVEVYWGSRDFNTLKTKIDSLKKISVKKEIIETYKEYGTNNEIKFDNKWWLFGFNNVVYDMEEGIIRDYLYEDYVSITCGYDWREPTEEELETVNRLIKSIMPIEEERELFLQVLCTAIDGRCLEKFIIFNASGRNGKGLINDLLLTALGSYGILGNNGLLFETSKTGTNPEKANLHKKRYVVFREPPEKHKFENSIIKELTGGGTFSARTHHEKETEKELNLTMIVECNKRPLFSEEPQIAEVNRIIDIYFRSTYVTDEDQLDETKYIYMANPLYKTKDFQHKHKYALLKILMEEHKKYYKQNNSIFKIPKSIKERTTAYLELSCNIVQWFKDHYVQEEGKFEQIKNIYHNFVGSVYYDSLSKSNKLKYNKKFFTDYIETNIFFKDYYKARHLNIRNVVMNWRYKTEEEIDE